MLVPTFMAKLGLVFDSVVCLWYHMYFDLASTGLGSGNGVGESLAFLKVKQFSQNMKHASKPVEMSY